MAIERLTIEDILEIHKAVAAYAPQEITGLKDYGALDNAVHKMDAGFGDFEKYPTIIEKAAALVWGITKAHAFNNANKRTAFASLDVFLRINGYNLTLNHDEKVILIVDIAEGLYGESEPSQELIDYLTKNTSF